MNATEVDHHRLRIDYSVTKRAHTPSKNRYSRSLPKILTDHLFAAPGIYMGVRTTSSHRENGNGSRRSPSPVDRKSSHRRPHRRQDHSSKYD